MPWKTHLPEWLDPKTAIPALIVLISLLYQGYKWAAAANSVRDMFVNKKTLKDEIEELKAHVKECNERDQKNTIMISDMRVVFRSLYNIMDTMEVDEQDKIPAATVRALMDSIRPIINQNSV